MGTRMKVEIEIPEYSPEQGLRLLFEEDYTIKARIDNQAVVIQADRGGLTSLGRFLLTLEQATVLAGNHFHLDDWDGLEQGTCELIIEKIAVAGDHNADS